jgi:hypothetical protein
MSDSYQAIYDAVRSRISGGNIGDAVREVAERAFDWSHSQAMIRDQFMIAASEIQRPAMLLKPKIYLDGDKWCALYGDNLQDGVAGFGDSPALAFEDFDKNWYSKNVTNMIREEKREERMANSQFGAGA